MSSRPGKKRCPGPICCPKAGARTSSLEPQERSQVEVLETALKKITAHRPGFGSQSTVEITMQPQACNYLLPVFRFLLPGFLEIRNKKIMSSH